MFEKLKSRWKVNGLDLFLIILTFALGGSACASLSKKLLLLTGIEKGALWIVAYILLITLLWPFCVLLISIPLFQFKFFKNYLLKIRSRIIRKKQNAISSNPIKIAIFASGKGSNAKNIIYYFKSNPSVSVACIITDNPRAGVLEFARENKLPFNIISKEEASKGSVIQDLLRQYSVDFIVLAGYLKKIPASVVSAFPNRIVNIHPALLPAYGGKGMYGMHVHEAVLQAKEKKSGITIHWVNEVYDEGEVIFQESVDIAEAETPESLAQKIHQLEHLHYPKIIEQLIQKQTQR